VAPTRDAGNRPSSPSKAHHTIQELDVTGGFLRGVHLEFVDGLNCIIGGRGTGKTTVLELLRYVLGQMPDPRASTTRTKALSAQVQGNLGSGRIRVKVQTKHGMKYTAERPWNDAVEVRNERGEVVPISFERDLIFKADVYSQNEIEEIATNPSFQLALIDKFIDEDVRRVDGELRRLQRDLDRNASELVRLTAAIQDLVDTSSEILEIEEKLKVFEASAGPDAAVLNRAHAQRSARQKERSALDALRGDLDKLAGELPAFIGAHTNRLVARFDPVDTAGPNAGVFGPVRYANEELLIALERTTRPLVDKVESVRRALDKAQETLAARHADQDAEFREVVGKLEEQAGRALERTRLEQRHIELTEARKELEAKRTDLRALDDERRSLLTTVSDLRDERFRLRQGVAERLTKALAPTVRVTITQQGNRAAYREKLEEALKGSNMRWGPLADRIVDALSPEEFSTLVQRGDHERLSERSGIDADRARRIIDLLRNKEIVYTIETVELEDLPRLELLDGQDYKDSAGLSTGQRCTTILPILLYESERPLLIDQPEDNLDNRFIYETVVKSLKEAKGSRQLIFVTHNPNITVLGDADRVFLLTSDGKQGSLAKVGTVDDLKEDIELVLDGGREAFRLRQKRYGH
jgi:ABC-type lipoprotein export system ATPase subunit